MRKGARPSPADASPRPNRCGPCAQARVHACPGAFGFYLHTVALQLGAVNGSTAAMVVGETAVPGIVGVWLLGDTTVPGLGWLGALGFLLAILGAVLVALFGSSEAERSTAENEMHVPVTPRQSPSTYSPATNG